MSRKLNTNDAEAIDLLLDQSERSRDVHSFSQPSESLFHRIAPAQKLLNLLDVWTLEEPPADLIQRTLTKIAASSGGVGILPGERNSAFRQNA